MFFSLVCMRFVLRNEEEEEREEKGEEDEEEKEKGEEDEEEVEEWN